MATNGSFTQQDQYKSEQYPATAGNTTEAANTTSNGGNNLEPSKDEVGWYFVEQYYTTLSRNPEKLHLFYGKRSQFVAGFEAEVSAVFIGRAAIQDRIKTLEFHDCKVRISNVDSQASESNIVIQVIGEISNKSAELKKFVQTFVLAKQPTGYFVLNDVFRYIKEDLGDEVETAPGQEDAGTGHEQLSEGVEMPKAQEPVEEPKDVGLDASVVDKKLEESTETTDDVPVPANGTPGPVVEEAPEVPAEIAKVDSVKDEPTTTEVAEKAVEEENLKGPELPKEPTPTPAPELAVKPAAPAQPAAPPKPMSWANRAAAAAAASAPKPAVPVITKTASPAPAAARAPPAQAATPVPIVTTPVNTKENENPQQSGWQSVGSDHAKRQNRPQSVSTSGPAEKDNGTMAYLRNVTEGVKTEELRETLATYGELVYFDINRQKNCAFVEFATPTGYQAAASANPHILGGEEIMVEPRRPKSTAYGGTGYNGARGGTNNRGRGGFEGGRGGQRGRGDFGANRGRGAARSRGGAAPAPA